MHKGQVLIFAFVVFVSLHSPATTSANPPRQKQHTDIHAPFFYSGETAYRAIELDGLKLKVTYFKDADKKCKNWVEQRPCWTEKDLLTKKARLTRRELSDFVNLINQSQFLLLEKTYGGAKAGQRFYSQTLKVKLGEVQKEVLYQSFPDAEPKPEAFKKVSGWLTSLVKRRFRV